MIKCDFELDLCRWQASTEDETNKFIWTRFTSTEISDLGFDGPGLDHAGFPDRCKLVHSRLISDIRKAQGANYVALKFKVIETSFEFFIFRILRRSKKLVRFIKFVFDLT